MSSGRLISSSGATLDSIDWEEVGVSLFVILVGTDEDWPRPKCGPSDDWLDSAPVTLPLALSLVCFLADKHDGTPKLLWTSRKKHIGLLFPIVDIGLEIEIGTLSDLGRFDCELVH